MHKYLALFLLSALSFSGAVQAGSNPWLPAPGSLNAVASYVFQTADTFYFANTRTKLPADVSQHTFSAYLEYGLLDSIALDARLGYAFSEFIVDPVLSPQASLDGMTDTNIGIRWRALDETIGHPLTVTFRAAGIIKGTYRTGALNAIGDGASGGEFSMLTGRIFDNGFSVDNEIGYRTRNSPVPDEFFASIAARYIFSCGFSTAVKYQVAESLSGIDIGSPGFTPARFPALNEDYQLLGFELSYRITPKTFFTVNYSKTVDGRNTTDQNIVGLTIVQSVF